MLNANPYSFVIIRYRPRMRVATLGCLCQPGFVLSRWDSNSTLPRLCSEDGGERALDGHFLRLHSAVLTSCSYNILQQLAEDGLCFLYTCASLFFSSSTLSTEKKMNCSLLTCFLLCSLRRQGREFSAMSRQIRNLWNRMDRICSNFRTSHLIPCKDAAGKIL